MATSNSTNFALNAQRICEAALRLARVLELVNPVDAETMNIAYQNLNIMCRRGKIQAFGYRVLIEVYCFRLTVKSGLTFQR